MEKANAIIISVLDMSHNGLTDKEIRDKLCIPLSKIRYILDNYS